MLQVPFLVFHSPLPVRRETVKPILNKRQEVSRSQPFCIKNKVDYHQWQGRLQILILDCLSLAFVLCRQNSQLGLDTRVVNVQAAAEGGMYWCAGIEEQARKP